MIIKYLVNIYNIYNATYIYIYIYILYIYIYMHIYSKYLGEIKTLKFAT